MVDTMAKREILRSDKLPVPTSPYSVATIWGNLLFTSGQVADDTSADTAGQTKQIMEKLKLIMEEAGTSIDNALKATCFLSDINDFQEFNAVYRSYLSEDKPARSTIEAKLANPSMRVEIEMIVGIPSKD